MINVEKLLMSLAEFFEADSELGQNSTDFSFSKL